jgi:hypothetical protein
MSDGRGQIRIGGRAGVLVLAPRVAWKLEAGVDPGASMVLHLCDNPCCCNPRHLGLGGYAANHADMDARGRRRFNPHPGESNPRAKLNDQAVLAIRFSRAAGARLEILAALHQVGQAVISGITTGRSWQHVDGPLTRGLHFARNVKLNPQAVTEIRQLISGGARQKEVAARFGVTEGTVRYVISGRGWKHVPEVQPCG